MPYPLNRVSPPITQLYGSPVTSKLRAAVVKQAQNATLEFPILDPIKFTPVDLTAYGFANGAVPSTPQTPAVPYIKFRFMEASGVSGIACDATTQTVDNATGGIVSCTVPPDVAGNAGVYNCEVGFFDAANRMLFSDTCYVYVDRGLFVTGQTSNPAASGVVGPPTLAEVRVNLRDQPEINRLIDEYEFDVADISEAVVRSVMYWNMAQPPVNRYFSTINFPWRYQLMDGVAAHLYEIAAGYYRRNVLQHQTAGLNVNDLNREQSYMQAWQIRNERWTGWVKTKKVEINMSEGFGVFGSTYSNNDGYRGGNW